MASERLNHALGTIETALARLEAAAGESLSGAAAGDEAARLAEELENLKNRHAAAVEERDRTIAKLRADAADIDKLKDEEIARLRGALEAAEQTQLATVDAEAVNALQRRNAALEHSVRSALAAIDAVIARNAPSESRHG